MTPAPASTTPLRMRPISDATVPRRAGQPDYSALADEIELRYAPRIVHGKEDLVVVAVGLTIACLPHEEQQFPSFCDRMKRTALKYKQDFGFTTAGMVPKKRKNGQHYAKFEFVTEYFALDRPEGLDKLPRVAR